MVDVAVGLVEHAVAVVVEPVPGVEGGEVVLDLLGGLAERELLGVPRVGAVLQELLHERTGLFAVVGGVVGRGVRDRYPVGDVALEVELAAGHLLVDVLEGLATLRGEAVEEHVLEVLLAEVRQPVGAVVAARRLGDLVVQRTRGVVRERRVGCVVTELDEEGEQLGALGGRVLDVDAVGHLDGPVRALAHGPRLAGDECVDGVPALSGLLARQRVGPVVRLDLGLGVDGGQLVAGGIRGRGPRNASGREPKGRDHGGQAGDASDLASHMFLRVTRGRCAPARQILRSGPGSPGEPATRVQELSRTTKGLKPTSYLRRSRCWPDQGGWTT